MEIFDEFIVVDEKSFTNLRCNRSGRPNNSIFCDETQFVSLEFKIYNYYQYLTIADIGNVSASNDVPLAQIIRWEWNKKGEQVIGETKILNIGGRLAFDKNSSHYSHNEILDIGGELEFNIFSSSSFVVRILKKREKTDQNSFLSLNSPDDGLTVQIGEEKITVSAHWLMSVSPVIQRMLSVEMKEKQQRMITLDELGVDMEQFKEFLGYISLNALHQPILPNPQNVLLLLKLADYFQIDWLKLRCDFHLINCLEIPLVDRFLLIEKYRLNSLKKYFLHLDVDNLRAFFKLNCEQLLLPGFNKEFLVHLNGRLFG